MQHRHPRLPARKDTQPDSNTPPSSRYAFSLLRVSCKPQLTISAFLHSAQFKPQKPAATQVPPPSRDKITNSAHLPKDGTLKTLPQAHFPNQIRRKDDSSIKRLARRAVFAASLAVSSAALSAQTLPEAVDLMLGNYPELKAAELQVKEREENIALERANRRPTLSFNAAGGGERFTRTDRDDQMLGDSTTAGFQGRQLLYDGGQVKNNIREAEHLFNLSNRSLQDSRETLALQLAIAYIDILKLRALIEMAEKNVDAHREVLSQTARKANQGAAPAADVALVRARVSRAQSTLQSRQQQLGNAINLFHKLTGIYPGELSQPAFPDWALPVSPDDRSDLARNPAIRSAQERLYAAQAKLKADQATRSPTLSFNFRGDANDGTRVDDLQEEASAMIVMNYDFFDGGKRRSRIQLSTTQILEEEWNLQAALRQVESSYYNAINDLNSAEERLLELQDYNDSMTEVVSAYQRQFELGKRALLNVLDVQNEQFSVESSIEEARQSRLQSAYRVLSATGELIEVIFQ
ncbi:MAG: TolC family protein [Verrucomicrobiota bacterium]